MVLSISTLGNLEQPDVLTPEKGVEQQPIPTTEEAPDTEPQGTPQNEVSQPPENIEHVVKDKTDEVKPTTEIVPGNKLTGIADPMEKEFINQIISELPNAKP